VNQSPKAEEMWGYADYKADYLSYPREKKVEELLWIKHLN
jgi:hypothetical protein